MNKRGTVGASARRKEETRVRVRPFRKGRSPAIISSVRNAKIENTRDNPYLLLLLLLPTTRYSRRIINSVHRQWLVNRQSVIWLCSGSRRSRGPINLGLASRSKCKRRLPTDTSGPKSKSFGAGHSAHACHCLRFTRMFACEQSGLEPVRSLQNVRSEKLNCQSRRAQRTTKELTAFQYKQSSPFVLY